MFVQLYYTIGHLLVSIFIIRLFDRWGRNDAWGLTEKFVV